MTGRHVLVTGGRVKIGRALALRLLRDGAAVSITTRDAAGALRRFEAEADYRQWAERLRTYEADFRDGQAVRTLCARLREDLPALDVLVNCAAQSVRRPVPGARNAGAGEVANSWRAGLEQVPAAEVAEAMTVNATTPFLLCAALLPLLRRSPWPRRAIVNVTGVDGLFASSKSSRHPHVNMSKAALNMLTYTSASECIRDGIALNGVDPGWISDESPLAGVGTESDRLRRVPPLDAVDGAARIYHVILLSLADDPPVGRLFQHYRVRAW